MNHIAFAIPASFKTIAGITILAILTWTFGISSLIHNAQAATLETVSDTLSDSDLGVDSAHRIQFTTDNGMIATQKMRISFDPATTAFDLTGFTVNDVYIVQGATKVAACGAGPSEMTVTVNAETIDFDVCSGDTIASTTTFIIDVGTTTGGNLINNPATAGSYLIQIGGDDGASTIQDNGDTRVVIIDDVLVTAAVDTIFQFTILGVNQGVTVNDDVTVTSGTSTATTVPFGVIAPGVPKLMAQMLEVNTNAINGFSVTVFADRTLTAGNGATIDEFIDGAATASSTGWQGPAATMGVFDTYGHWGLTSEDDAVSSTTPNLWGSGEALYVGNFIDNPVEVFYHTTPVEDTAGVGIGSTTVAYKVEISSLQEAAKDYSAVLTYIATPVF